MPTGLSCAWCAKPLIDAEHAKKHVVEQCTAAPWRAQIAALEARVAALTDALAATGGFREGHPVRCCGACADAITAAEAEAARLRKQISTASRAT